MGKAQTIRLAVALTVIGVGVPLTVIANSRATSAGITPSGAVSQVGSQLGAVTGGSSSAVGASSATAGTVSGAARTAGTTSGTSSSASCSATGNNLPADKMTVGASTVQQFSPGTDVTLLCARMKTSSPADLTFSVTLECSIVTSVTTTGNDTQSAFGDVKVWIEVDGKIVSISPQQPGAGSDNGQVTFCNRTYSSTTMGFPPTDSMATINTYQATKDANAFNWVAMNVGNLPHTISVHATLTSGTTSSKDMAQAVVGSRTVVVNETNTAQNATQ